MIMGKLHEEDGIDTGTIAGFIAGFATTAPVRIAPSDLKGIDYMVTIMGLELGVGWKKKSSKENDYISLKLDSPFLPAPANCALITQDDGYALVWNRDKPKAEREAA